MSCVSRETKTPPPTTDIPCKCGKWHIFPGCPCKFVKKGECFYHDQKSQSEYCKASRDSAIGQVRKEKPAPKTYSEKAKERSEQPCQPHGTIEACKKLAKSKGGYTFPEKYERSDEYNKSPPSFEDEVTNLPRDAPKTCDSYEIKGIPYKFNCLGVFRGYGYESPQHPLYRTTSSDYGFLPPNVVSAPIVYHARDRTFTKYRSERGGNFFYRTFNI